LFRELKELDYDDIPPPSDNDTATEVGVAFFPNSISNVQAVTMDYWVCIVWISVIVSELSQLERQLVAEVEWGIHKKFVDF